MSFALVIVCAGDQQATKFWLTFAMAAITCRLQDVWLMNELTQQLKSLFIKPNL